MIFPWTSPCVFFVPKSNQSHHKTYLFLNSDSFGVDKWCFLAKGRKRFYVSFRSSWTINVFCHLIWRICWFIVYLLCLIYLLYYCLCLSFSLRLVFIVNLLYWQFFSLIIDDIYTGDQLYNHQTLPLLIFHVVHSGLKLFKKQYILQKECLAVSYILCIILL